MPGALVREARRVEGLGVVCEHAFVMYGDALLLLYELADREDERFQSAAARWHAHFVLEARLPLREAESVMTLLCRLRGADRHVVRRRLLSCVERAGLMTRQIGSMHAASLLTPRPRRRRLRKQEGPVCGLFFYGRNQTLRKPADLGEALDGRVEPPIPVPTISSRNSRPSR